MAPNWRSRRRRNPLVTSRGPTTFTAGLFFGATTFGFQGYILKAFNPKAKKDSIRRNDFGGPLGSIKKDKIFFFGQRNGTG